MAELKVRATLDGSNYQGGIMRLGGLADGLKSRLAAAFTVGAIAGGIRRVMNYADNIEEMSQRVGISTKTLQEWSFAAKQNGADAEKLVGFIERITAAAQDMKNAKGFAALGITPEGMNPESLFASVQAKTRGKGAPEILAIMDSLGIDIRKTGAMMNFLQADLDAAAASANKLGAVMDDAAIRRLAALNDQLSIVGQVLMANFAPALLEAGKAAIKAFAQLKGVSSWWGARTANFGLKDVLMMAVPLAGAINAKKKWDEGEKMGLGKTADEMFAKEMKAEKEMAAKISAYKAPASLPPIGPPTSDRAQKFKAQSDSLLSVGNFLGAGRGAIDSLQKEANRIAKDNGRKLDKIADKLPDKSGGTIVVP